MAQKKPLDEAHMHEGHRARLLDTVVKVGLENVSDVQAMEFILFYIFPRGDVNPLAHRLLHEFGSIANVLDADVIALKQVKGMGERSAKALVMLSEMFNYYVSVKLSKKINLGRFNDIADYFEELLRFRTIENFMIVGLDAKCNLIQKKTLSTGSVINVGIDPTEIAKFVISAKPAYILFAHNHPGGSAKASARDIEATKRLKDLIEKLGISFVDHFIVADDGVFSVLKDDFIRVFK